MTTTPILWFLTFIFLSNAPLTTLQQELGSVFRQCYDSAGNYTPNTQYQANLLTTLLPSLASNAPLNTTGYYSTAVGRDPDRVFGFAQCMSAATMQDCRTCLNQSTAAIADLCPRRKQAFIRYENCALRYSNQSFVTQADMSRSLLYRNTANATEPALFSRQMGGLMRNLSTESAQSPSRFAVGNTTYNVLNDIYGMTQCTRDISSGDCFTCLEQARGFIGNEIGARIYFPSCSLRFEVYAFYTADGLTAPPPPRPSSPPPSNDGPPPPPPPRSEQGNGSSSRRSIIIGVVVGVTSILIIVILFVWCVARKKAVTGVVLERKSETIDESKPLLFDLNEIRAATDNFSEANELGQGGFGVVYKGTLANGQQIAVKRLLASSNQGITELKNEVALLAKLQHRNLVRLLGCCLENQENILIYEFVPNSSLEKFLFDPVKRDELKWDFRIKIIEGIARGLLYLHEDSRLRIIHRDLKSANILLDSDMNAKISDFGLAKIFGADQTQGNTNRIAGTFGYMSPEYAMHGLFSTKSDVFSFGVLVLEIVTGRKNSGFSETGESIDLLSHVWKHWTNGNISDFIDENLHEYPVDEVVRCVQIGLLCVQEDPTERPNMSNVVLMFSSESLTISAPSPPAFCITRSDNSYPFPIESKTSNTTSTPPESVNEASITDFYPR